MPAFIVQVLAFLSAALPAFLAFGTVTTAINQFVQKFAASRFPRFAAIVNTICVDYLALLAEVGAIANIGPRAAKNKPVSP